MARHKRRCKEKYSIPVDEREDEVCGGNTTVTRQSEKGQGNATGVEVSY